MAWPATYLDLLLVDRENKMTSIDDFMNEALTNSYLLQIMIENRDLKQITQGGRAIVDFIQVAHNNSFTHYAPGDQQTPVAADTLKKISLPWRYSQCNYQWENEEIFENENDVDAFLKLREVYESSAVTSAVQGFEDGFWAIPSTSDMESTTVRKPYSIPCFITEYANALPTGFTTVMGVNPSTTIQWQNQRVGYTVSQATNPTSLVGLLAAFQTMANKVQFKPVMFDRAKKHQTPDDTNKDRPMIVCNQKGQTMYQNCLYATNDRTQSPSDAGNMSISFSGRDLTYVTALDYVGIYGSALAGTTQTATNPLDNTSVANASADNAPRFYFINGKYLYPIFHTKRFMMDDGVRGGTPERPNTYVQYFWNWDQLWCRSRRRQGIIYPSAL